MDLSTLLILLFFGTSYSRSLFGRAPVLNVQRIIFPVEKDGITYEYGYYGVVVTFSEDTINIVKDDETLAGMALTAFEEAYAASNGRGKPKLGGMAVLITGNEAYFASPMSRYTSGIGGSYFFYDMLGENAPLRQQLAACRLSLMESGIKAPIRPRHGKSGNCGEITAMQESMWHMNHPGQKWPGSKDHQVARVTFWADYNPPKTINPCQGYDDSKMKFPGAWGCMQFATANGISWARNGITAEQVKRLDDSQISKIVDKKPIHEMWCQEADNPERLEEPADNLPPGNPEPITQEELDQFGFETEIEFSD